MPLRTLRTLVCLLSVVGFDYVCASLPVEAAPFPSLSGYTPPVYMSTTAQTITVTGSNFRTNMTATLTPPGVGVKAFSVPINGLVLTNPQHFSLSAVFSVSGSWLLTVRNTDGKTAKMTIGVMAQPPPIPTPVPLTITCPANQTKASPDGNPVTVSYPPATSAGGTVPLSSVSYSPPGSTFIVGSSTVIAAVTDASVPSVTKTCSFTVAVTYAAPPPTTCQDPTATNLGGPLPCTYASGYTLTNGPDPTEPNQSSAFVVSRVKAPAGQMHFTTGMPLRLFGDGSSGDSWMCPPGHPPYVCPGEYMTFYVDGQSVGQVPDDPNNQDMYELRLPNGLPAGDHVLTVIFTPFSAATGGSGTPIPGAVPVTIHVDVPPTHANTINLTADIVLSGATDLNWTDCTVNGNGHVIRDDGTFTGQFVRQNCFISGLGTYGTWGATVTTTGNVIDVNNVYEATAPETITVNGTGTLTVTGSEWRENNLVTFVSADPNASPIREFHGTTTGTKIFAGNKWGSGILHVVHMDGWQIGGLAAATSNVAIGPRAVLWLETGQVTAQGNYLHHDYRGGWSQGFNLEGDLTAAAASSWLAEHNVIRESSWPIQSVGGEFRYNLVVDQGGHNSWRSTHAGTSAHHNVFTYLGIAGDFSGLVNAYQGESALSFYNNTFDVGPTVVPYVGACGYCTAVLSLSGSASASSFRNNVVTGFSDSHLSGAFLVAETGKIAAADYNLFYNPLATATSNYLTGAVATAPGAHDFAAAPQFKGTPDATYKIDEGLLWTRQFSVFDVLSYYRQIYTPAAGSPLIDSGDPNDGGGVDRGAVGAGTVDANDKFGTITGTGAVASVPPVVVAAGHPRLVTPTQIVKWKAKAAANDPDWLTIKASADQKVTWTVPAFTVSGCPNNAICYDYEGNGWGAAISSLVLAYEVGGSQAYCSKVLQIVAVINAETAKGNLTPISTDSGYPSRSAATGLAQAYDGCFSFFDAATKTATYATMNAWYDWYKANAYDNAGPAFSNYFGGHVLGFGWIGLASAGENPRGAEIRDYIRTVFNATVGASFASGVMQGGYPPEVYVYGTNHFVRLLNYMVAIRNATGEDLITGSGIGQKIIRSLIYNRKPNRWQMTDEGDYAGSETGIMDPTLLMMLPALTAGTPESGWAQFFFQNRATSPDPYAPGVDSGAHFQWYDPSIVAVDYRLSLPLVLRSPGDSHVVVRTDWTDAAVWSSFKAGGTFLGGHASRAAGHLAIQRGNDYLLINAGQWKGPSGAFGDPQAFDGRSWRLNTLWYQNPYSADYQGAQGYWGTDAILATQTTATYVYTKADFTSVYTNNIPTGLKGWTRSVVELLPSGVHVVFDHVQAGLATDLKKIVWHVNPNGTRLLSGNVFDTGAIGSSRLFISTPCCLTTPMLSVAVDPVSDTDATPSTYRLEVTDVASTTMMDVITIMQPTPSTTTAAPSGSVASSATQRVVTAGGYTVIFSLTGDLVSVASSVANNTPPVILNGSSYTLRGHPRVYLDGSAALQTSPRNTIANQSWAAMRTATNAFIHDASSYPNVAGALNEAVRGEGNLVTAERFGTCANAALLWWSQGGSAQNPIDPSGYLALAKYCLNHVEDFYGGSFGCDTAFQYCGRAISSDGDYAGMRLHNIAIAYTIVRSLGIDTPNGLSTAQVTAFANKVLNDRSTSHNGIDVSDCETDGRGVQPMTVQPATVSATVNATAVTFSVPVTLAAGGVLLPSPPTVYQSVVGIMTGGVNGTTGTLTAPAKYSYAGSFYYSPPLTGNPCGLIWVQRHSNTSPPMGSNPAAYATDYSATAGIMSGPSNLAFATVEGYLALGLALADDDARARTLVTQAYDYFLHKQLDFALSMYDGLNTSGPAYMWDRQAFVLASVALMIRRSVNGGPISAGPNLLLNQARTAYYWREPWAPYRPPPWGANADFDQGYALYPASRGVTATYAWLLDAAQPTEAAYLSWYLADRGDFTTPYFDINNASYATFPFMLWDPASTKTAPSALPTQYHFTAVDAPYCLTLGLACFANYGWDHMVSRSDWTPTATMLTTNGGFLLNVDHTDTLNGFSYYIGRRVQLMSGDAQFLSNGLPWGGVGTDNLISIGGDVTYGVPQPAEYGNVATPTTTERWAGDAQGRYAYILHDILGAYKPAANIVTAQREVAHLKKSGAQDYVISHDVVSLSTPGPMKAFWHYTKNGQACAGIMRYDSAGRRVTNTQSASQVMSVFLPGGVGPIALTNDAPDFSYPSGFGYTCRVVTCPSLDGSTCNPATSHFEEVVVQMPVDGVSGAVPALLQLAAVNFQVVQIADPVSPKVAAFAAGGTYSSIAFTSTHTGIAQYLIAGLTPGLYLATVNGVPVASGVTVSSGDATLYFESSSGAVQVSVQ